MELDFLDAGCGEFEMVGELGVIIFVNLVTSFKCEEYEWLNWAPSGCDCISKEGGCICQFSVGWQCWESGHDRK